jgi:hypothetical protein
MLLALIGNGPSGTDDGMEFWEGCSVMPTRAAAEAKRDALEDFLRRYNGSLNVDSDTARRLFESDYEGAFWNWNATMADHQTVFRYWHAGMQCAQNIRLLRAIGVCAFSAGVAGDTVALLTELVQAEKEVAALGDRLISLADFDSACRDPGFNTTAPVPIFHLLRVKRNEGEEPVFHAEMLLTARTSTLPCGQSTPASNRA